ncbi:MAG: sporulation protein [Bacteroidetes bacterium]|nr:sporulation protein [Bacteroidota bacterium]
MDMNIDQLLEKVTNFLQNEANTETVVGESFQLGEFTCIPVVRLGMGFGSGSGEGDSPKQGKGSGGGVGGGMGIEPIGFLATKGDQITFISTKTNSGLAAAFEKVPDLISKFLDKKAEATS